MWDLPRSRIKPMSPALASELFTTEPPGKSILIFFTSFLQLALSLVCSFSSSIRYKVRWLIWGLSFVLMQTLTGINIALSSASVATYNIHYAVFSCSFILKYFLNSFVISSLTYYLIVCALIFIYLEVFQFSYCCWFLVSFHNCQER